ncbi:MAG: replication restart helicase PriA [Terriglobales bacterium]
MGTASTPAPAPDGGFVEVALPVPLDQTFTYRADPGLTLQPGMAVRVPWGRRHLVGLVTEVNSTPPPGIEPGQIRPVAAVIEGGPLLDATMLDLVRWAAVYYQAPVGEVMRGALPPGLAASTVPRRARRAPARDAPPPLLQPRPRIAALNPAQNAALAALAAEPRRPVLLHGVTGSGKTAVYLAAIEHELDQGRGALLLVPEIGLTPALDADFQAAFPGLVAVLHSSLAPGARAAQWRRLHAGAARVAIGTRSAVLAPLPRLGLIVVDEEHDGSYKQQEAPRYHARDLAILRARLAGARVLLGSATPSLESYAHARSGKYLLVEMHERVAQRPLPAIRVLDMAAEFRRATAVPAGRVLEGELFAPELLAALEQRLASGQQSLLLINRRGFAPVVLCRACGAAIQCRHCALALSLHLRLARLLCHFCGFQQPVPATCPGCASEHLYFLGSGSEKVEQALAARLPQARIARLDRDTARNHRHFEQVLASFRAGELDILVGTQMIAKGHDLPGVTLVGVLQADAGLHLPDFRAAERAFQLLTQVAGRAGRGDEPGEVLFQALHPDHYAITAAAGGDFAAFYHKEANFRRWMHYPPFAALAAVQLRHRDLDRLQRCASDTGAWLRAQAPRFSATHILGPAPAPLARAKGEHRIQFLFKSQSRRELAALLRELRGWAAASRLAAALIVDVDPLSL